MNADNNEESNATREDQDDDPFGEEEVPDPVEEVPEEGDEGMTEQERGERAAIFEEDRIARGLLGGAQPYSTLHLLYLTFMNKI